jgi:2,3-bisphosphoglycerate-independent phosphoglycerate mutase
VTERNTNLHLIGLLSEKSSHGSIEYPLALLRMAKAKGLERVYLHLIFDGRSTQPGSAPAMLEKLEVQLRDIGLGQIASGMAEAAPTAMAIMKDKLLMMRWCSIGKKYPRQVK